jgi:2-polyprenyl-6-methoxyphenol hydroxylase-like FAD-dependent oxidoreductase
VVLVTGAGPIGLLAALLGVQRGLEVHVLDLWIERRAASDKPISPDTVEDYRSLIAKKVKPALGGKRLQQHGQRPRA